MSQPDTVSLNDGAGTLDHDGSSSAGEAGNRGRYNYAKCAACRARKKKVVMHGHYVLSRDGF